MTRQSSRCIGEDRIRGEADPMMTADRPHASPAPHTGYETRELPGPFLFPASACAGQRAASPIPPGFANSGARELPDSENPHTAKQHIARLRITRPPGRHFSIRWITSSSAFTSILRSRKAAPVGLWISIVSFSSKLSVACPALNSSTCPLIFSSLSRKWK